jgi:hypothetical protein
VASIDPNLPSSSLIIPSQCVSSGKEILITDVYGSGVCKPKMVSSGARQCGNKRLGSCQALHVVALKRKVTANDTERNLLLLHREIKLRSGTGQRYSSLVADEQLLDPVTRRLMKLVGDQRCPRMTVASTLLRNKQTHDQHETDVTNNKRRGEF